MRSFLKFFKQVLAATVGVSIFYLIFLSLTYNYISRKITQRFQAATEITLKDNSILHIKLDGEIVEHILEVPNKEELISISEINAVLEAASEDPKIKGLYIEIDDIAGGLDSLEALRQAFEEFKQKSEKPVVIYSTRYTEALLALASVANYKILHPSGYILFNGLSIKRLFYKRLLKRFDVEAILFRAGKYKASSMPYVSDHMTEQDKAQWLTIMQTMHKLMIDKIISDPLIEEETLEFILNSKPLLNSEDAIAYHLVNKIGFSDAADDFFNEVLKSQNTFLSQGTPDDIPTPQGKAPTDHTDESSNKGMNVQDVYKEPNYISYNAYKRFLYAKIQKTLSLDNLYRFSGAKIGIIPLEGDIVFKDGAPHTISEELVLSLLKQYVKDEKIKLIVIIIDSPGGYSIPTATISHEIERAKQVKPIICYVRNAALSGGQHIAVSCTKIVAATEGTLLGSIGVWSLGMNLQKAAAKHLSIDSDGVKTHEHAEMYRDQFHEYSEEEKKYIQDSIENEYHRFKSHVKRCRNLTEEEIEAAAEGRVFSAIQAKQLKLIDDIGSLEYAIDLGLALAGVDKKKEAIQVIYPVKRINMTHLAYLIKGIIYNKGAKNHHLHGEKMYHAGYTLDQESESL